ncbi:MAG: plasmid pRiA4b ORF-3 family protein [Cyclobacteriaceae bacterium]|nr:plasmid pRiA4b ORF-3 family protein [Cyclobacteriaceae bacterium]
MASQYDKNYTEYGYSMHYKKSSSAHVFNDTVLQFYVELMEIKPVVWRRIQVPFHYNFWDLHTAVQDAMGWWDSHLHNFSIRGKRKRKKALIGIPDFHKTGDLPEVFPGWEIPVTVHFNSPGVEAVYEYDYGDGWMHMVKLEGHIHREIKLKYPLCIAGERACPPEDCGGVYGYYDLLKVLSDPKHADYHDTRTWVGEDYDPEYFDHEKVKFDDPYKRWTGAFLER